MLDKFYIGKYTGYVVDDHSQGLKHDDSTDGMTKFMLVMGFFGVMYYLYQ